MAVLILTITLQLILGTTNLRMPPYYPIHGQEVNTTVVPFNPVGMPVKVNTAVATNRSTDAWLEYSISNVSKVQIAGTHLRVFIVDPDSKLITTVDGFSGDKIEAGMTLQSRVRIGQPIGQNGLSIVAVTKVVGESGVWEPDLSQLQTAVRARLSRQSDVTLKVFYEPNRVVTDADRSEIFKLIIEDLINDDQKSEKLMDRANVIVLREDLHFDLPQLPNVKLLTLDQDEIQRTADKRGRVIYLIYRPFVVEGSRVLAQISLRDQVARRPGMYVPFKFTYLFTCVKKDGRWSIEKSLGYAQS